MMKERKVAAGVKDYTTLLLCSYSTTSAIQLSIEILGPLSALAFGRGGGENLHRTTPPWPASFGWHWQQGSFLLPSMQCNAMQSRLACVSGFPCLASSLKAAAGRLLRRRTTAIRAHCPPPPDRARLMSFSQCQLSCLRHHQSTTSAFGPAGFSLSLSFSF
jgi:hypothetical protein